ncbi:MAG: YciI family protein [Thermomicrobiales bacterium]
MKVALLYYYDPAQAGPTEGEVADWLAFEKDVNEAGIHVYEAGFQPAARAQTVSVRDGQAATEDGPVVGVGNVISGVWVIDVASAEDAAAWAQRIPTATYGKVEVRPIVEFAA